MGLITAECHWAGLFVLLVPGSPLFAETRKFPAIHTRIKRYHPIGLKPGPGGQVKNKKWDSQCFGEVTLHLVEGACTTVARDPSTSPALLLSGLSQAKGNPPITPLSGLQLSLDTATAGSTPIHGVFMYVQLEYNQCPGCCCLPLCHKKQDKYKQTSKSLIGNQSRTPFIPVYKKNPAPTGGPSRL